MASPTIAVSLNATDNASRVIKKVEDSTKATKEGFNKLSQGLSQFGIQAAGIQGPLGQAAESLLKFAGGGPIAIAVGVGLGAIVAGFMKIRENAIETRKSIEGLQDAIAALNGKSEEAAYNKALLRVQNAEDAKRAMDQRGLIGNLVGQALSGKDVENELRDAQSAFLKAATALNAKLKAEEEKRKADAAKALADRKQQLSEAAAAEKKHIEELTSPNDLSRSISRALLEKDSPKEKGKKWVEDYLKGLEEQAKLGEEGVQLTLAQLVPTPKFKPTTLSDADVRDGISQSLAQLNANLPQSVELNKQLTDMEQHLSDISLVANVAADAWTEYWQAVFSGQGVFDSLAKGAIKSLSQIARAKVGENIASAIENLAKGFAAPPGVGAKYFAASATHFKAAALWGIVAGGAGALGGGSGGGSGGSSSSTSNKPSPALGETTKGEASIIIQGGILDMSNPEQARAFANALETLSGRRVSVMRG